MRISDWSSDVCSSDLDLVANVLGQRRRRAIDDRGGLAPRLRAGGAGIEMNRDVAESLGDDGGAAVHHGDEERQRHAARRRCVAALGKDIEGDRRSEEHTSELQSLMRISYAVFCLKKKNKT